MRRLLLRGSILLSLAVPVVLLAACGGPAGGVPTATIDTGTSVPAVTVATPTDTAAPPTNTAVPPVATNTVDISTTPPAAISDHVLTNKDNNSSITLKVGDTLLVELSDRQWSTPKVDSSILAVAPLNIMVPQGAQAWKYNALAPGQTDLTSEGQCPPNPGGVSCNSVLLYKVTVTVMAAGQ